MSAARRSKREWLEQNEKFSESRSLGMFLKTPCNAEPRVRSSTYQQRARCSLPRIDCMGSSTEGFPHTYTGHTAARGHAVLAAFE